MPATPMPDTKCGSDKTETQLVSSVLRSKGCSNGNSVSCSGNNGNDQAQQQPGLGQNLCQAFGIVRYECLLQHQQCLRLPVLRVTAGGAVSAHHVLFMYACGSLATDVRHAAWPLLLLSLGCW